ncbi:MAG: glycogen synthase GlgA [Lautropia sp.]
MRVLHAAAEVYPLLKTGGLADVTAALPAELAASGFDVRMVLPGFPPILDGLTAPKRVASIGPGFGAGRIDLIAGRLPGSGLDAYAVDAPWLYDRPGNPYLADDGREWADNHRRFAAFGWVAAHLAAGEFDPRWRPDVLHAHDWHAGLAPAYLAANPGRRARTIYTIHNLAYQGPFPLDEYRELGLQSAMLSADGLEFHGHGNFMKAGLVFSERLTTVSPRYAQEICTIEFGSGMEGVLAARRDRLTGILNGIDTTVWNPQTDPLLPAHYDVDRLDGKAACKAAVQSALGLEAAPNAPLFTMVSRLTDQKGSDLVLAALPELLRHGGQLTILGTGDHALERAFAMAQQVHRGRVAVQLRYDETLAHRLIAAADVILVPSRFEPCGLTQMYGLRYGTLPLVRRVGGLADTVTDAEPAEVAAGTATGFVFDRPQIAALESAIRRTIEAYREPAGWQKLIRSAMTRDHAWSSAAREYAALYRQLLGLTA